MNDGGPAFPTETDDKHRAFCYTKMDGSMPFKVVSLRDWFAGMAMQGIHSGYVQGYPQPTETAKRAYKQADAMLAEREKTTASGKPG